MYYLPIIMGAVALLLVIGGFFLVIRNFVQKKSCTTSFFKIMGGIFLILGGGIFLFPGLEMMRAFAEAERNANADVIFTDAPIFLGSPEAWVILGVVMIIGGIVTLYIFFKQRGQT